MSYARARSAAALETAPRRGIHARGDRRRRPRAGPRVGTRFRGFPDAGAGAADAMLHRPPPPLTPSGDLDEHPTLDAGRGLCGHRHAHARHRRGEHGAVPHRRGPRHGPERPAVGRRRVHARARQRRADGRRARRSPRPPAAVHLRPGHLHRRFAGLRPGAGHRDAQLRARRAGRRRRDHVRRLAGAARPRLPEPARARRRAGRLRRGDRRLVRGRPARRRRCSPAASTGSGSSSSTCRSASSACGSPARTSRSRATRTGAGSTGRARSRSPRAWACSCSRCCAATRTAGARR